MEDGKFLLLNVSAASGDGEMWVRVSASLHVCENLRAKESRRRKKKERDEERPAATAAAGAAQELDVREGRKKDGRRPHAPARIVPLPSPAEKKEREASWSLEPDRTGLGA
ncbi:hypothetical protein JRQ81_006677 [Phrynocephalus forsythii]|uniref:Uncharacterized protein n=1 Tax=Phrynocephalus forsythii TaxID=171643 RepID=A0A9Q0XED1_9SAUR|nr:hypothetical protein JRQ81_006677 [Phrynocephalus forsythii]